MAIKYPIQICIIYIKMKASVFKLMFFPSTTIFSVSLIRQKSDPRQLANRKIIRPILRRALRLKEMTIDIKIQPWECNVQIELDWPSNLVSLKLNQLYANITRYINTRHRSGTKMSCVESNAWINWNFEMFSVKQKEHNNCAILNCLLKDWER